MGSRSLCRAVRVTLLFATLALRSMIGFDEGLSSRKRTFRHYGRAATYSNFSPSFFRLTSGGGAATAVLRPRPALLANADRDAE
ncbi:hypothetical protein [Brucella grignonensis]|uniref:hypothetical protein n=1 Tax=Brucella grignonensis TaxID=94627 RepID=UPI0035BBC65D